MSRTPTKCPEPVHEEGPALGCGELNSAESPKANQPPQGRCQAMPRAQRRIHRFWAHRPRPLFRG